MAGERVALIVAVDEYRHPGLAGLASPVADADALVSALADPERGEFHVDVLHNEDSSVIAERVEALLMDRAVNDVVLLHFSCHGVKDPNGELYLAAANTRPDRLASTAVDAAMVNRLMRRSRAKRVVLLLDCCYGGAFERGVIARAAGTVDVGEQFAQDTLGGGRGRVVITASSAVEYAFEGSSLTQGGPRPSYFTGAVVEGIVTGKADRDNDGRISLSELYDYVYDRVRGQTPEQTPSKWEFGTTGELYISRNPAPEIVPVKVPDPLMDLIEHPHVAARLTAVQELAGLAAGPRLGVALGAVEALRGMLADDSRRVDAEAAEALKAVAPHVSETAVDFGVLAAGAPTPAATITVTGPPLALSFTISTFPAALVAKKDGRTVYLTLDTATPARVNGQVTIDTPTGAALVEVTAVIEEPRALGATSDERMRPKTVTPEALDDDFESASPAAPCQTTPDGFGRSTPRSRDESKYHHPGSPHPPGPSEPSVDAAETHSEPRHVNAPFFPRPKSAAAPGGTDSHATSPPALPWVALSLVLLGSLATGIALFLPLTDGDYPNIPAANGFTWLLTLAIPSLVTLLAGLSLKWLPRAPISLGVICGATLYNMFLVVDVFLVVNTEDYVSFGTGFWIYLMGTLLTLGAISVSLRVSREPGAGIGIYRDSRAGGGLALVVSGLVGVIITTAKFTAGGPGNWEVPALLALVAVPVALFRFNRERRATAISVVITYVLLATLTIVGRAVTVGGFFHAAYDLFIVLSFITVVAGCILSQFGRVAHKSSPEASLGDGLTKP